MKLKHDDGKLYRSSAGKIVRCPQCENMHFVHRRASFHTAGASLVGLEWLAPEVHALVCLACSRIEWFYLEPQETAAED